jgi:hypothetical protein
MVHRANLSNRGAALDCLGAYNRIVATYKDIHRAENGASRVLRGIIPLSE